MNQIVLTLQNRANSFALSLIKRAHVVKCSNVGGSVHFYSLLHNTMLPQLWITTVVPFPEHNVSWVDHSKSVLT